MVTRGADQGVSQLLLNLVIGREYSINGRVKVVSGTPVVAFKDSTYNEFLIDNPPYSTDADGWFIFTETFVPDQDNAIIYLGRGSGGFNGEYYFDDFQIEEGTLFNKFRPRFLDFQGDAEFKNLDAIGDLYVDKVLSAFGGVAIIGDIVIGGEADISGELRVFGDSTVDGNIIATQTDSRLMGSINLKHACDSVSPRMYTENGDFVIDIGTPGTCLVGEVCTDNSDCVSGTCNGITELCQ